MSINPDDQADLLALQNGESRALDRLVLRWEGRLYGFAWRYLHHEADARDMVASVFVRLFQQCHRLRDDTNLSAWLFTTTANLCANHQRWRRRHPNVSFDVPAASDHLMDEATAPDAQLQHKELLTVLQQALANLPHDLKTTLLLHHYERLSCREISTITGCSIRGVETRLYRARQLLRARIDHLLHEPLAGVF